MVGHLASLPLALVLFLFEPGLSAVALGVLAAALLVAWVVVVGRWSLEWPGWVQAGAAAVLCASYVAVACVAFTNGLDALASRSTFATPTSDAGLSFVVAALAALATAALLVAIPLPIRPAHAAIAAIAALAGAGGAGAAVAVGVSGDSCQDFRFDRDRWNAALGGADPPGRTSDAERLGEAIVRCDTVNGAGRATVRRLLGGPANNRHTTWHRPLGITNDALGPGDGQELLVEFGADDRARTVYLSPP